MRPGNVFQSKWAIFSEAKITRTLNNVQKESICKIYIIRVLNDLCEYKWTNSLKLSKSFANFRNSVQLFNFNFLKD